MNITRSENKRMVEMATGPVCDLIDEGHKLNFVGYWITEMNKYEKDYSVNFSMATELCSMNHEELLANFISYYLYEYDISTDFIRKVVDEIDRHYDESPTETTPES